MRIRIRVSFSELYQAADVVWLKHAQTQKIRTGGIAGPEPSRQITNKRRKSRLELAHKRAKVLRGTDYHDVHRSHACASLGRNVRQHAVDFPQPQDVLVDHVQTDRDVENDKDECGWWIAPRQRDIGAHGRASRARR